MNLIILGNGFDLAHGLKTSYCDLRCYLKADNDHANLAEVLESICEKSKLWIDFEHSLGNVDGSVVERVRELFPSADVFGDIKEKIGNAIYAWLLATVQDKPVKSRCILDKDDFYFSFNYTLTLEDYYDIKDNIKHIHGDLITNSVQGNIIFGHANSTCEDENSKGVVNALYKDVYKIIENNEDYFRSLENNGINVIKVYGFSYSDIDLPYFKKIREVLPNVKWEFGYYKEDKNIDNTLTRIDKYVNELNLTKDKYAIIDQDNILKFEKEIHMEKLNGESMNMVDTNVERLKELFPECVCDGKIDFDALRTLLGDNIEVSNERYSFNWIGKNDSLKLALTPTTGTLRPCKEKSVDWDKTQNLYIEGDNLEVLKTLKKTYHNQIKMIYIDPPYNTGNDFVYHDDFHDNIANYVNNSGQAYRTNPETAGRYHTDWLNMIYPRLKVAKDLLSDDGVIFISIDDNEVDNLKKVCSEIFGSSNFLAEFPRVTKKGGKSTETYAKNHDYVLVFCKNINSVRITGVAHIDDGFKYKDEYFDKRGAYKLNQTLDYNTLQYNTTMDYPIELDGKIYVPGGDIELQKQRHNGIHGKHDWVWRWSKQLFDFGYQNGWIEISKSGRIYTKTYLNAIIDKDFNDNYYIKYTERTKPITTLDFVENSYSNDNSNKEISSLMNSALFDYVKPTSLVKMLVKTASNSNAIVLDFFSGSGTTADAVMQLNAEDGGNRKFILVQLPEKCDEKSEAYKAGYNTICEIGQERIRRAGKKIYDELLEKKRNAGLFDNEVVDPDSLDFGFKVFRLDSTNINPWDSQAKYTEDTLMMLQETIKEGRTDLDIAYEIMLKYGIFNMNMQEQKVNGKTVYSVGEDYMIISLQDRVTMDDVKAIADKSPKVVVFKESGFDNDNDKLNAEYTLQRAGVQDIKTI